MNESEQLKKLEQLKKQNKKLRNIINRIDMYDFTECEEKCPGCAATTIKKILQEAKNITN